MNLLGAAPSPEVLGPLERVFRQALVRGAPRPYGVVVEDRAGQWRATLANLSLDSRRAAVLVARDGSALSLAARWSVGGGMFLPPSTRAMEAALTAARNAATDLELDQRPTDPARPCGRSRCAPGSALPPWVWRALVGERGTVENLAALAKALGCLPLIDEGPSLLLSGIEANDVYRAWAGMQSRPTWAGPEALEVVVASERGAVPGFSGMSAWNMGRRRASKRPARCALDLRERRSRFAGRSQHSVRGRHGLDRARWRW